MTPREVVRAAVEFAAPAWLPYNISVSPQWLARSWPSCEVEGLSDALLRLGAVEENGQLVARRLFATISPTPAALPHPYRPLREGEWVDEWGVVWTCPETPRVSGHPLESGWDGLTGYTPPNPSAPGRYAAASEELARHPDRYRLGWVWFTLFERLWFLRGFNAMLVDPYLHHDRFVELRDLIVGDNLTSIQQQLELGVDGIFFSDDWGTQTGLLMNPEDWRRWYKPWYARMFDSVHAGGAQVWMHLCGNVTAILPDLIEIGLDVLNPVQPQAMDVDTLAACYAGRLCFYGGVDVQGTLPLGTPEDVRAEVRHLVDILGSCGGGYIGGTSHTILPDTPPENIIALFEAFRELSQAGAIRANPME